MKQILLVARREVLEARRNRGALLLRLFGPLLFVVVLGGLGLALRGTEDRSRALDVRVAVPKEMATGRFVDGLRTRGLDVRPVDDVGVALLTQKVEVGLRPPADIDRRLAAGEPVEVELLDGQGGDRGQRAQVAAAAREAVADVAGVGRTTTTVESVKGAPDASRDVLALGVGMLVGFAVVGVFTTTSLRFSNAGRQPALEALLVLPLRRQDILLGLAVADVGIGLASQAVLLVPVIAAASLVNAASDGSAALGATTAAILTVTAFSGTVVAALVGYAVGVLDRDRPGRGIGGIVNGLAFGGLALAAIISGIERTRELLYVPIVGQVILARRATTGIAGLQDVLIVLAVSAAAGFVAIRQSIRRFDGIGLAAGT